MTDLLIVLGFSIAMILIGIAFYMEFKLPTEKPRPGWDNMDYWP